ncbi:hypothetical protein OG422_02005 [Streptomyces sp. NBC_01525]|uniref:hypothetical protein n=1 Tax=Streptomyces sp. NBC_01525 TaxID=2903893 RepID=UPI0038708BDF
MRRMWVLDHNEISALVHPRHRDERNELTLRHLPIAGDLLDLRALPALRAYTLAGPPRPPLLTAAQTRAVRHPYGDPSLVPGPRLDADEHHLVNAFIKESGLIFRDGRWPAVEP